jgi:phenylacetaldehyde dehydrogenase
MNAAVDLASATSPAPITFERKRELFIDGEWVESQSRQRLTVVDPSTSGLVGTVADANAADVDRAVRAARAAFESGVWSRRAAADRARALWQLAALVDAHTSELAQLESVCSGIPISQAMTIHIPAVAAWFRYMAGWAGKRDGELLPASLDPSGARQFHAYSVREPVGVVTQIVPWNAPLWMAAWKLAPALAAGCTCILKPAEQTPFTALRLGELIQQAGIPGGVVNILPGSGESCGAALVEHPGVDKVAFTGSTAVGRWIQQRASASLKRLSLELGGKSPVIVLGDANPGSAIAGAAFAIFANSGQLCSAGSRLFVHRSAYECVVEGVCAAARAIRLGPALEHATELGPLASRKQQARVLEYIESARRQGASIAVGGNAVRAPGCFVEPTVLLDVNPSMRVVREEIFGPVLVVQRFDDLDEVVAAANDTQYGLAASVWTSSLSAAHRVSARLRSGTVWVNCHHVFDPALPFGGCKQSGIGRENGGGALDLYTEQKTVCISLG